MSHAETIILPSKTDSQIKRDVEADFARVFTTSSWRLFKRMAEFHLERAARLRISDVRLVEPRWRLLARNAEKRLRIGIGMELLLKAVYLRYGFVINMPKKKSAGTPDFPFTWPQANAIQLDPGRTAPFGALISGLEKVSAVGDLDALRRGLIIAQVFRNKEGHSVVSKHRFDARNYREIENSLVEIYARAFNQALRARFFLKAGDKPLWCIHNIK